MNDRLTHFDAAGNAAMVDVTQKPVTDREAVAEGWIRVGPEAMRAILEGTAQKGDVLGVARVSGIMAAKQTSQLIPLCHPLPIGKSAVDFRTDEASGTVTATCAVRVTGQTGVELEALTGVSVALLTIYDMLKAVDRGMEIGGIRLMEKTGGKSGTFRL